MQPTWPAQLAAQPTTASSPVVFPLCQEDGRVPNARAPPCATSCLPLRRWMGWTTSTSRPRPPGLVHSPLPLSLVPLRHGRSSRCRSAVVAVAIVVSAPPDRVHELLYCPLHRAGRALSARPLWSRPDAVFPNFGHRRSPSPSPQHQLIPDLIVFLVVIAMSPATSSPSPLSPSCTVCTAPCSPVHPPPPSSSLT